MSSIVLPAGPPKPPRVLIEDFHVNPPFGFRIRWKWSSSHWMDVEVFEIGAVGRDSASGEWTDTPQFTRQGASCSADFVSEIDEAERYLHGYIKWDGCSELDQGCPHWCGPHGFKAHIALLKHLYVRAQELLLSKTEDEGGGRHEVFQPWGEED